MSTRYVVTKEVSEIIDDGETLCLQQVYPVYNDEPEYDYVAYRFIRRCPKGRMKAQKGQANCTDLGAFQRLLEKF